MERTTLGASLLYRSAIGFFLMASVLLGAVSHADSSDCYRIRDEAMRNACLARTKADPSYCYKVREEDQRNACLAETKADRSYCYRVRNQDQRNACLAKTPR
jgi:hypothetical protein